MTKESSKSEKSRVTPLWIISLFLTLTETVIGVVVTQTIGGIQIVLLVFAIIFPLLIAGAFFIILWKKPYVLYPPSEFGDCTDVYKYVSAMSNVAQETSLHFSLFSARSSILQGNIYNFINKGQKILGRTRDIYSEIADQLNGNAELMKAQSRIVKDHQLEIADQLNDNAELMKAQSRIVKDHQIEMTKMMIDMESLGAGFDQEIKQLNNAGETLVDKLRTSLVRVGEQTKRRTKSMDSL